MHRVGEREAVVGPARRTQQLYRHCARRGNKYQYIFPDFLPIACVIYQKIINPTLNIFSNRSLKNFERMSIMFCVKKLLVKVFQLCSHVFVSKKYPFLLNLHNMTYVLFPWKAFSLGEYVEVGGWVSGPGTSGLPNYPEVR